MENDIVLFETKDREVKLSVSVKDDTVWLTQSQMTELFSVDRTVITRHVNNIFKEGELERESNVQKMHIAMQTGRFSFIIWMLSYLSDIV